MKKRGLCLLITLLTVLLPGCGKQPEKDEASHTDESVVRQQSAEEKQISVKDTRLYRAFRLLHEGEAFYVEADMFVVRTVASAQTYQYHLTLASDRKNQQAEVRLKMPEDREEHIIIRDKRSYRLDESEKTYTSDKYEGGLSAFLQKYTADWHLGETDGLIFEASGTETITLPDTGKEINAVYEKFRKEPSSKASEPLYFTYYYDNDKPCMEIMENASGKTTFLLRTLMEKIPDQCFELPSDYSEQH